MDTAKYFPSVEDIEKASGVLKEILEPTPFQKNADLSARYGADIFLKREDLQMVRSYKIRGAYNKIRSIDPEVLKYGIVCASAGNHAQGVAFSSKNVSLSVHSNSFASSPSCFFMLSASIISNKILLAIGVVV